MPPTQQTLLRPILPPSKKVRGVAGAGGKEYSIFGVCAQVAPASLPPLGYHGNLYLIMEVVRYMKSVHVMKKKDRGYREGKLRDARSVIALIRGYKREITLADAHGGSLAGPITSQRLREAIARKFERLSFPHRAPRPLTALLPHPPASSQAAWAWQRFPWSKEEGPRKCGLVE